MILTYYTATTMIIIAYLLGSIPSAVWIGKKYYGIDIREYGSKNAGTTNMLRVLGRRAALPVFGLDFLKGFVAVTIIDLMKYDSVFADGANENWFYILRFIAVFAAVVGHIFPIFANFKGGKAVATTFGYLLATGLFVTHEPIQMFVIPFVIFMITLKIWKMVSLSSIIGIASAALITTLTQSNLMITASIWILWAFVTYRHKANIERIRSHEEKKISWM